MPVEFLPDEQAEAYGKFAEEPTRPELERFVFLDAVDRECEHAREFRDVYAYEYEDAEWSRRFRTFLHGRAWTHAAGPKALSDHAVGRLRRNRRRRDEGEG